MDANQAQPPAPVTAPPAPVIAPPAPVPAPPAPVPVPPASRAGNDGLSEKLTQQWDNFRATLQKLAALSDKFTAQLEKLTALSKKLTAAQAKEATGAAKVVRYSFWEKVVAAFLFIWLLAAFLFGFWAMANAFHGRATLLSLFMSVGSNLEGAAQVAAPATPAPASNSTEKIPGTEAADTLILLATSAGWLGATLSALRSLCDHYAAAVENPADRFYTQWSIRWLAGPLMGAGLTLMVFTIVQSGVLPFAIGAYSQQQDLSKLTVNTELAAIGFGSLVGLGAKEVIEKLIQALKTALPVDGSQPKAPEVKPGSSGAISTPAPAVATATAGSLPSRSASAISHRRSPPEHHRPPLTRNGHGHHPRGQR